MENNSIKKILLVALSLSLVCSVVVSVAAVSLKPIQKINKTRDMHVNVLQLTGLYRKGQSDEQTEKQFAMIEPRVVDLQKGRLTDLDAHDFELAKVLQDPQSSRALSRKEDLAQIKRLPAYMRIYLLKNEDGGLDRIVLPIYGYGLWSTLYGFLSLKADGTTIDGLQFYDHKETPGLGGEVDNPAWRALWHNKRLYDEQGRLRIAVVRGRADRQAEDFVYRVDGLSGATLTSRGVSKLVQFWFGPLGYRNFIETLKQESLSVHE